MTGIGIAGYFGAGVRSEIPRDHSGRHGISNHREEILMENETLKRFCAASDEAKKLIADGYTDVQLFLMKSNSFINLSSAVQADKVVITVTAKKEF